MGTAKQSAATPRARDAVHAVSRFDATTVVRWSLVLGVAGAAFHFGLVRAETDAANLQVSIQVLPHAQLQADATPVSITAADVQRGYLDVSRHYRLQTNAPDRVVLQLNPRVGLTDSIDVTGFGSPVSMGNVGVEVTQRFARDFTLSYRLWLNAAATPGEYPLPVQLAATVR